jgi:hypothetical protein
LADIEQEGIGAALETRWRGIFYQYQGRLMTVSIVTQPAFRAGEPELLFDKRALGGGYDVSADGKRFIILDRPGDEPVIDSRGSQLVRGLSRPAVQRSQMRARPPRASGRRLGHWAERRSRKYYPRSREAVNSIGGAHSNAWLQKTSSRLPTQVVNDKGRYRHLQVRPRGPGHGCQSGRHSFVGAQGYDMTYLLWPRSAYSLLSF